MMRLNPNLLPILLVLMASFTLAAEEPARTTRSAPPSDAETQLPEEFVFDWADEAVSEAAGPEDSAEPQSLTIHEEEVGPDELAAPEAATQTVKITLFKIKNWPEFKVATKRQCRNILGRRVCINVPQAFQRNCELIAFAEIKHPSADSLRRKIENCARQAVAAGALASIYSGDLSAGAAALKAYLTACLAASGVDQLDRLSVKVRTETKCGKWRPR